MFLNQILDRLPEGFGFVAEDTCRNKLLKLALHFPEQSECDFNYVCQALSSPLFLAQASEL